MPDLLIPRVFHQIWLGGNPLPDQFKQWADRWLSLNPGWTMQWWTDAHLPDLINAREFHAADKMAAKSDILRYEIIATHGGIYIDADMEPLQPIEPLLREVNAFYGDERPDTPCNAILGCAKNDPFFAHLVRALPGSFAGPGDIVDKTGPRFLKREIENFFGRDPSVQQDAGLLRRARIAQKAPDDKTPETPAASARPTPSALYAFDWRVFYPYYYTEPHREWDTFPDAVARHHWTASWWKNGGI